MKRLWNLLISLELCLVLLALVSASMAAGSFRLKGPFAEAINAMPLFSWLAGAPFSHSWWLWATVILLALLATNTLLCSVEALRQRRSSVGLLTLLAPQLIHLGFLLIVAAHLISAYGAYSDQIEVAEYSVLRLPSGATVRVETITAVVSPMGMPLAISCQLALDPRNPAARVVISPNHPWFSGGYGVYIKQAAASPYPRALLEVHREPGSALALAGAVVFTLGNIIVLWLRSGRREAELSTGA